MTIDEETEIPVEKEKLQVKISWSVQKEEPSLSRKAIQGIEASPNPKLIHKLILENVILTTDWGRGFICLSLFLVTRLVIWETSWSCLYFWLQESLFSFSSSFDSKVYRTSCLSRVWFVCVFFYSDWWFSEDEWKDMWRPIRIHSIHSNHQEFLVVSYWTCACIFERRRTSNNLLVAERMPLSLQKKNENNIGSPVVVCTQLTVVLCFLSTCACTRKEKTGRKLIHSLKATNDGHESVTKERHSISWRKEIMMTLWAKC